MLSLIEMTIQIGCCSAHGSLQNATAWVLLEQERIENALDTHLEYEEYEVLNLRRQIIAGFLDPKPEMPQF